MLFLFNIENGSVNYNVILQYQDLLEKYRNVYLLSFIKNNKNIDHNKNQQIQLNLFKLNLK